MLHQTSGRIHNKNVSTHLIGNIKQGKGGKEVKEQGGSGRKETQGPALIPASIALPGHTPETGNSGLFALCTLDGECS